MATCSICLRETTPYRDRTGLKCDRSAPDGDPIQCVSVGQRAWQARAEELELELAKLKAEHGQPRWYAVTHVGFQHCLTEEAARERAEWSIGTYRDLCDPEWDPEIEAVEYGRVTPVGVARVVSRACDHLNGCDESWDYALVDPATYTEPPLVDCGECEDCVEVKP